MSRFNPEVQAKWVKALRSGEYKQGRGQLKQGDKFCCLGVLCDLYSKEKNIPWVSTPDGYMLHGNGGALPTEVALWLHKGPTRDNDNNPLFRYRGLRICATALNDVRGLNFNEIADLIEEN